MNILRNFVALVKGMPDWHEKYNQDMSYLYDEVNSAKSDGIINTYVHSKSGTNHTLTGAGAIMRFTARAPWIAGDAVTVNGTRLNPLNLEGTPLPAGAFVAGMQVVAIQDGQNLQFLTQSYADQFANINSQMENKTNKNSAVSYDLPLAEGFVPFESAGGVPWDCRYGKDDLGIVYVCARLKVLLTTEMSYKVHLATLPTGYRPRIPFSTTCGMRYSGDEGQPLCSHIDFYVNGDIYIFPPLTVTASQITIPPISFFGS